MNNMNMRHPNNPCCNTCQRPAAVCDADSSMYSDSLGGMPLGMGYVPWQQWNKVYDINKALERGTIFPELDLPFYGCIPRNCPSKERRMM